MDETKSGNEEKEKATSLMPNDARAHHRTSIKMVESVVLIWLDTDIDEESDNDSEDTVTQLRRVVNNINTFDDVKQCIEFIDGIDHNHTKVCIVVSGSLGPRTVPRIHHMPQVDSIFIFCTKKIHRERWTKDWSKIKGVFTEIALICVALKRAADQCEYNAIPISLMATNGGVIPKSLDQLDCSFMYTQIFKGILSTITFEQKRIQEFIELCCLQFGDIKEEIIISEELEKNYRKKTPLWWYTCETFIYPMINGALRLMDVEVTIRMAFYIVDLCRQIQQLHTEQFVGHGSGTTFTVYRGQGVPKEDFQQMTKTKGGLLSFNSFVSAGKDRDVSVNLARRALSNPDLIGILFVIAIDPTKPTTPFASINAVSYSQDKEEEILFSIHTVFRIRDIKSLENNRRLYQVNLTLTSKNDKDLRALNDCIRTETGKSTGWDRLGLMLFRMGQSDKAQQIYETLLEQVTKESDKGDIYYQLGRAKDILGEYREAIKYYESSLTIREQWLPPNHPDLSKCYDKIGVAHDNMRNYSKALLYYEKALDIDQQILPPTHPDLAVSYNNIGTVYKHIGEYDKALLSHQKALEIQEQSLPANHPDLAKSYVALGIVHNQMGRHSEAIASYENALDIQKQSPSPNDSDLAISYNNIGNVYNNMGEYAKALSYYEKDLEISQKLLPPNHPDLATSYNNIGNVYKNMGDYAKALLSHEKALEIRQSLPSDHPDLASSYNNIGLVYENMRNYSKARSLFRRAVNIGQQSLPANHPTLQTFKDNVDRIKNKL